MPIIDPTNTQLPISSETIWREVRFLNQGFQHSPFYYLWDRRAIKVFRTGRSFSEIAQFSENWVHSDDICDHLARYHLHNHDFQLVRFEYTLETYDDRPYILVHESEKVFRWVFDLFGMHESLLYHFIYDTAGIVQYNTTHENSMTLQFFLKGLSYSILWVYDPVLLTTRAIKLVSKTREGEKASDEFDWQLERQISVIDHPLCLVLAYVCAVVLDRTTRLVMRSRQDIEDFEHDAGFDGLGVSRVRVRERVGPQVKETRKYRDISKNLGSSAVALLDIAHRLKLVKVICETVLEAKEEPNFLQWLRSDYWRDYFRDRKNIIESKSRFLQRTIDTTVERAEFYQARANIHLNVVSIHSDQIPQALLSNRSLDL